ncbi:MAG: acetyl-CoA carboxylase biotin carboxylase subunit [Alphaproteobacteria bacterium]|nr:acetyl-CoA carboxylase biotin carboxylase subunit [Alphaproteobacteria bacterium]
MFEKVLIANRGEIALRIHRACKEMGIKTVAVHSTADRDAMHVRLADEAICIGKASSKDSYLNKPSIISAALVTGADAIHPGYGFLSENADFAEMIEEHGISFIGPSPKMIRLMGDKIEAKKTAIEIGLPTVPGSKGAVENVEKALEISNEIGYPVIIKASAGGGGKGMKVCYNNEDMTNNYFIARTEAKTNFTSDVVYIEKYLENPRHIEIQVLGDKFGHVVTLGERDCSLQRRNQKVLEESPSPALNKQERARISETVRQAMEKLGYFSAGTLEFLYENGEFYFMEMNTRLQVEHPVTEMVTGIDLVQEQIKVAAGLPLSFEQKDIRFEGFAIECRINAENPETFVPSPGKVKAWHVPGGLWVRVDSEVYAGYSIPPYYDSMIAKLIVFGRTRNSALMRLRRALQEFVADGIQTTIPLHQKIISTPDFIDGQYNIHWLEKKLLKES